METVSNDLYDLAKEIVLSHPEYGDDVHAYALYLITRNSHLNLSMRTAKLAVRIVLAEHSRELSDIAMRMEDFNVVEETGEFVPTPVPSDEEVEEVDLFYALHDEIAALETAVSMGVVEINRLKTFAITQANITEDANRKEILRLEALIKLVEEVNAELIVKNAEKTRLINDLREEITVLNERNDKRSKILKQGSRGLSDD